MKAIGLEGDTIYLALSQKADSIRVNGAEHRTLAMAKDTCGIRYALPAGEPFARMTAFFPDGAVIYTNPFARYDASAQDSTFRREPQPVNWPLTVLYNLAVLALTAGVLFLFVRLFRKKK